MEESLEWLEKERVRLFSIDREGENVELREYLDKQMSIVEEVFGDEEDIEDIKKKLSEYTKIGRQRIEGYRKRFFSLSDEIEEFEKENEVCEDEKYIRCRLDRSNVLSCLNEHDRSVDDSKFVYECTKKKNSTSKSSKNDEEGIISSSDRNVILLKKEALFRLAFSMNGKRDFKKGNLYSKLAIYIDPEYVDALVQYGRSKYRVGGTLEESLQIADKCISLNPDHHLSHWLRSSLLEQLHRSDEAMEEVKEMIRIDPYHPWSSLQLASIFDELKSHSSSVKYYTYSIVIDPRDPLFFYNRGYSLKRVKKNYSKAYQDFTMALILDHSDIEAWNNRGIISSEEIGSLPDAERDFTNAIYFDPTHANSFYNRGVIREGLGKINEAFDDFTIAIDLKQDSDVYYYRAFICFHHLFTEMKYISCAVSDLLIFRDLQPEDKEGKKLRTIVCTKAVDFYTNKLKSDNPLDLEVHTRRSDAYRGLEGMEKEWRMDVWKVIALTDLKERYEYLLQKYAPKFSKISLLGGQKVFWFKLLLMSNFEKQ